MAGKANLKVLFVSAEVVPFAKTGGLADVAGSLPLELANQGNDVRIVMPRYKKINSPMHYVTDFPVNVGTKIQTCIIRESGIDYKIGDKNRSVPVYFVDNYEYFDREYLYCYSDEAERFAFFCRAVIDMLPKINFQPDIIHCNDWQSGPISMLLKEQYEDDPFYSNIATIYTIHNLQYQGNYPKDTLKLFGLEESFFTPDTVEFYGSFSFMKAGIVYSDVINTVSETYAKEIQTAEYGELLEGLLKERASDLYGIVNGISYDDFNPQTDPRIYKNFSSRSINNKKENKFSLQREVGLPVKEVPVIGLISRLVNQKGLDIIEEKIDDIMSKDLQFILLGSGDPYYENLFTKIKEKYPEKMGLNIGYNPNLAQRIYAGCDMFLMPSKFEPCGLGQLISLRYGTIPVVRSTGGLADTIRNFSLETGSGNGFSFKEYSSKEMLKTIDRALDVYNNHPDAWGSIVQTALKSDYSWSKSADKYLELYYLSIGKHKANIKSA